MPQGTHPPKDLMDLDIRISNATRLSGEIRTRRKAFRCDHVAFAIAGAVESGAPYSTSLLRTV